MKKKKYELGIGFQKTDCFGRIESHVSIREVDDKSCVGGYYLCTLTFVGRELNDAMDITRRVFLKTLNRGTHKIEESQLQKNKTLQ